MMVGALYFSGFATEIAGGHGSHTAGTAAGVMLDSPAELEGCSADEELGCVGGCFESNVLDELATNGDVNLDTLCPAHNCDGWGVYGIPCLTNNGVATLTTHGGFAPGAKIAVFDVSADDGLLIWAGYALNGLWDAVAGTGCKVHSNSWAGAATCQVDSMSVEFDGYMYEVGLWQGYAAGQKEHCNRLLILAVLSVHTYRSSGSGSFLSSRGGETFCKIV